jgi:hypothetical protein
VRDATPLNLGIITMVKESYATFEDNFIIQISRVKVKVAVQHTLWTASIALVVWLPVAVRA